MLKSLRSMALAASAACFAAAALPDAAHAASSIGGAVSPIIYQLMVFAMAIFVGYYVVWSVTPALHTPLMSVTNAISSVIVVGALLAVAVQKTPAVIHAMAPAAQEAQAGYHPGIIKVQLPGPVTKKSAGKAAKKKAEATGSFATARLFGFLALVMAAVNIFGGFLVTQRMLAMYKKKEK